MMVAAMPWSGADRTGKARVSFGSRQSELTLGRPLTRVRIPIKDTSLVFITLRCEHAAPKFRTGVVE